MSSEQFDKHIRKKLESVRPPYQEQAWQNFKNLLPQPWYVTFFKTYKGWFYGSLSTLAVLTTSYLYYQQKEENKNLHEEIATLKSQNSPLSENAAVLRDSISAKQIITDSVKVAQQHSVGRHNSAENTLLQPDRKIALAEQPAPELKNAARAHNINKATSTPSRIPKVLPTSNEADEQRITPNKAPNLSNKVKPGSSDIADKDNALVNEENTQVASTPDSLGNNQKILTDTLTSPIAKVTTAPNQEVQQKQQSGNLLAAMQIRLGLTTDLAGLKTFAAGPALELFWADQFSLNAALTIASQSQLKHAGPPDFNRITGKRFEDVYQRHIPRYDRIREIEVKTSLIRLPITLNYYLPTNSKFSFMLSGGTSLNLSAYQAVTFRSSFQGEERFNRFEARPETSTLNNVLYGVGVQYQHGRIVGQVTPYLKSYFREPEYFNPGRKIGLNFSLKYNLKK